MKKVLGFVVFFLALMVLWNFLFCVSVDKRSTEMSTNKSEMGTIESYTQTRDPQRKTRNPSAEFLELLKQRGFSPKILTEDTKVDRKGLPKDSATGAKVTRLYGEKAGLPPGKLPGAQFLSMDEVRQIDMTEKKTGLFLVDIKFVPRELPEALKFYKYTLKEDGTLLDGNGEPIIALITSEVYLIEKERTEESAMFGPAISDALSAHPFAWRCYSFTPWAVYHSGFHRWYDARTWAGTYGADASGGCSWASPYTNVDYIRTYAAVGGGGDSDHCFNCCSEYSRDTWDVGYFWPAHGVPVTTHYAVYADGNFSFSRIAHLTW